MAAMQRTARAALALAAGARSRAVLGPRHIACHGLATKPTPEADTPAEPASVAPCYCLRLTTHVQKAEPSGGFFSRLAGLFSKAKESPAPASSAAQAAPQRSEQAASKAADNATQAKTSVRLAPSAALPSLLTACRSLPRLARIRSSRLALARTQNLWRYACSCPLASQMDTVGWMAIRSCASPCLVLVASPTLSALHHMFSHCLHNARLDSCSRMKSSTP